MAVTLYLVPTTASGFQSLTQIATATAPITNLGWTVGTITAASGASSIAVTLTKQATSTFSATDQLTTATYTTATLTLTTGQTFRSVNPLNGTFSSATNWNLSFGFVAVASAASQTGRVKTRLYKASSTAGASATQLTIATAAGLITGTTSAALSKTTASASFSSATWTPTSIPAFSNEYLFLVQEWSIVAAGTVATADSLYVQGISQVITSNFTAQDNDAETVTAADSNSATNIALVTDAETVSVADVQSQQLGFFTALFVVSTQGPPSYQ